MGALRPTLPPWVVWFRDSDVFVSGVPAGTTRGLSHGHSPGNGHLRATCPACAPRTPGPFWSPFNRTLTPAFTGS